MNFAMRAACCAAMALSLPGCLTLMGGGGGIEVQTVPTGALVTVEGVGECESPCSIKLAQPRRVTIAKAGYNPVHLRVTPETDDFTIEMTLAAPTEEVDTTTLPDLD